MNLLQQFNSDGLYTRYAVDEHPDDNGSFMHVHEQCEIYYFVSGDAEYLVEGARYPLKPGDILIMRPAESHRNKMLGGGKYERYIINFSPSVVESIDPQRRLLKAFFDRPLGRENFYSSAEFGKIQPGPVFYDMCRNREEEYDRRVKVLTNLFKLLDMINSAYLKRGVTEELPPQSLPERIVAYVNAHLSEELSVPALAECFFLSPSQFSRVFKQATGAAPWEYITIKRLTAAREKIRSGFSAQDAGESCGFRDYSAFYRSYVKYFGCSPKEDKTPMP